MSRKHYRAVAEILKNYSEDYPIDSVGFKSMVTEFADMFLADNDRFDRNKFLEACGVK